MSEEMPKELWMQSQDDEYGYQGEWADHKFTPNSVHYTRADQYQKAIKALKAIMNNTEDIDSENIAVRTLRELGEIE